MWPLVYEEPDWMSVYGHLQDEVRRGARLDSGPDDTIVMGVNQGLVQVQHQHLLTDHVEAVSGYRRKGGHVIADSFVLLNLGVK